ncbi:hypothetical protein [Paraburkholderia sp. D1E]|uniref:hypothetical protein n=1 Tax=Paraburkholderia sp. D1E TaxID=3461398 RepID=UPI004045AE23
MKQIERKNSPQRALCEILRSHPDVTMKDLAELRSVHPRAVARQIQALVTDGFVYGAGYPRRYRMTSKPLPDALAPTPRSRATMKCRSHGRHGGVSSGFLGPAVGDLEPVMYAWAGA